VVADTEFVLAQLRPLLGVDKLDVHAFHLRQQDGRHEIDVVLESADGRVVGVEIKATASAGTNDARHLAWLHDNLGPRFVAGVVLNSGRSTRWASGSPQSRSRNCGRRSRDELLQTR
jgi:hypothetical protein